MSRFIILFAIIAIYLFKTLYLSLKKEDTKHLFISFFIITVPFTIIWEVGKFKETIAGTIEIILALNIPIALLTFLIFPLVRWNKLNFSFSLKDWVSIILLLLLVSLINPFNANSMGTIIFAYLFISHIFLFKLLLTFLAKEQIIRGVFDGFFMLCIAQFALAICFPLLGMTSVTSLFYAAGEEWATRVGSRSGAIGTFAHPGTLALFVMIVSGFIVACYLNNFKKKQGMLILILNVITLILTYSRTSYLAFIIVIFFIIYIHRNAGKRIFSISNFFKFILPVALVLLWLIFFSPLSDQFLKSDSSEQYDNRLVHYFLAISIFLKSPFVGVGINTHLAYLANNYSLIVPITTNDFFSANPIHNIHFIVLAETGLFGVFFWFRFIIISIKNAKNMVFQKRNQILSLSLIGIMLAYTLYGITGWAPFSSVVLPYFLFFAYIGIHFKRNNLWDSKTND